MVIDFIKREIMPNILYYIIAGSCMGLGIAFLKATQILTGGFPGLSLILNHLLDYSVGTLLVLLNAPLIVFGYYVKGMDYVLRVLICTVILSVITDVMIWLLYDSIRETPVVLSAVFAGVIIGIGMMTFVRNHGNPGGLMIFAQWVSEKFSVPLGYITLTQDLIITLMGIGNILTWQTWMYSFLSIFATASTMILLRRFFNKQQ